MPNAAYDTDLFGQDYDLLAIKVEYSQEAAEEMRLEVFVFFFLKIFMFLNGFALSIDLEDGGDATAIEIWDNEESVFSHPDGDGLQI